MLNLKAKRFYIYGGSLFGKALVEHLCAIGIPPLAIIDKAPKKEFHKNIPLIRFPSQTFDRSLPVLVSILGYSGVESSLNDFGFDTVITTKKVFEQYPEAIKILNSCGFMWMSEKRNLQYDEEKCEQLYQLLGDEISKKIFKTLCQFRQDPSHKNYPWPSNYTMYFPDDINSFYPNEDLKILDIGAYDGDTFEEFWIRYGKKVRSYFALEASPSNIAKFKHRIEKLNLPENIVHIEPAAVGLPINKTLVIREMGSASQVEVVDTPNDTDQIVNHLNLNFFLKQCEFNIIKMDIEGADFDALLDASEYISACRPHLALSLYHKPEDLWRIALYIEKIAPKGYAFYIRQEGHWGLETQLYAKPIS